MKLPQCFYSKAFWILLPIIVASVGSAYGAIDAELNSLDERLRANEIQVAENNVPELKTLVNDGFQNVNTEQKIIQEQILTNYRLLCKISEGKC